MMNAKKVAKGVAIVIVATATYVGGLAVVGCQNTPVQTSITRIEAKADSIARSATDAQKHNDKITGKENEPHKAAIKSDLSSILIDAKGIHFNAGEAKEGDVAKDKELQAYKTNPLVWVAMFIWTWAKVALGLLVAFGALYPVAFILGFFNPASGAYRISQMLVRFLPAANVIRWFNPTTATVKAAVIPLPYDLNKDGKVDESDYALATTDEDRTAIRKVYS